MIPQMLIGDQVRLQQVLINLTKNALKFTHKGHIQIKAAYDYYEELLQVKIIDSGKGIKFDEMKKLFTLFGKIERTEDSNTEGIGMGLTICQKILMSCGGKIEVHSDGENLGTTFFFCIPMSLPSEERTHRLSSLKSSQQIEENKSLLLPAQSNQESSK